MKNQLIKLVLFVLVFMVLGVSCTQQKKELVTKNCINVIPQPDSVKYLNSSFTLTSETKIVIDSDDNKVVFTGKYLIETLSQISGMDIKISNGEHNPNNIILITQSEAGESLGEEGYKLIVNKNGITLKGESAGLFYGVQTLLQLIPTENSGNGKIKIPTCEISDNPRFPWRGLMLDESRHFFGTETVKKWIDIMAMYKLNTFHWHLTDDQGWRIEIDKYPRLTEVGAWREGTGKEPWTYFINPATEGKPKYGGYYTKEDIREIIEYADERFITIIPEIELPGHSTAALRAYPELTCAGVPWEKPEDVAFEQSDPFCVGNEKTFEFFENVLSEVIELFPSKYIHIGGDECKKTPWEECEKCRKRMEVEKLDNVEELQSYFIKRIEKIVQSKGRKIIGWDEILEGGLAPDATVMCWRGEEGGIEAAKQGHHVVITNNQKLYFIWAQSNAENHESRKRVISINDVYNYNPVPTELNTKEAELIMGADACLWSEYTYSDEILESQLLPRLTALAEIVWTDENNKDWDSFQQRLKIQFPRFDMMDYNYFIPMPTGFEDDIFITEKFLVEFDEITDEIYSTAVIRYTTDGSEPDNDSKIYTEPFSVTNNTIVKAKTFMPSGGTSSTAIAKYNRANLQLATVAGDLQQGINLQTFKGKIKKLSDFEKLLSTGKLVTNKIKIPENMPADYFGLVFTGFIDIPADGLYTFYSTSDDGSQLFVNGNLLIDNDKIHGMETKYGKAALAKGKHTFKVVYFENNYGEGLKVEMAGPGLERQEIPGSFLFRKE